MVTGLDQAWAANKSAGAKSSQSKSSAARKNIAKHAAPKPEAKKEHAELPGAEEVVEPNGITSRLVAMGASTRPAMMLWGRNTPKYVRAGFFRYAVLQTDGHSAILYQRPEKDPDRSWKQIWKSRPDVHQPPTLLVDRHGRLHVLYVDMLGTLKHVIFNGSRAGVLEFAGTVSTRRSWGLGNFYMGAAYNRVTDAVLVCSSNFTSGVLRCGSFQEEHWSAPRNIASLNDQLFLYPIVEPAGTYAWVASSAYKRGQSFGSRTTNIVLPIDSTTGARTYARQAATYGSTEINRVFFESDAAIDHHGNLALLVTPVPAGAKAKVDDTVAMFNAGNGFALPPPIEGVRGSAYTLFNLQDGIYFVGAGTLGLSKDDGHSWTLHKYELARFPHAKFEYGVAQSLQARSGTAWPADRVSFLQELVDRDSKRKFVVEIDLDPAQQPIESVVLPAAKSASRIPAAVQNRIPVKLKH